MADRRVAVIGGGIAGLTAAWRLLGEGVAVTVFERDDEPGGMAGSVSLDGVKVDRYYHYFTGMDSQAVAAVPTLMPGESVAWKKASVGMFLGGRSFPFATPLELAGFSPLSWVDRARLAAHLLATRSVIDPERLRDIPAREWVQDWLGTRGYAAIWQPLVERKFGAHAGDLSAAWLWARIQRMASMPQGHFWRRTFGHVPGGGHRLVNALADTVAGSGGVIRTGRAVTGLELRGNSVVSLSAGGRRLRDFDAVISTVPLPVLGGTLLPGDRDVQWPQRIDYLPVAVMVMVLSRSVSPYFWLNTNDPEFSTAGFIEYTNLEPLPGHPDLHLLYVPFYAGSDGPAFSSPEGILDRVLVDLRRVSPGLERRHIQAWGLFRDAFGQSVCRVGDSFPTGEGRTPWQNLFVTDSAYLHPQDRTVDGAMGLGRRAASQALEFLGSRGPKPSMDAGSRS